MTSEIPVTQAREELAELINRVAYGHERIILTRHSKPVACLVPPEDLARLQEGEQEEPGVPYTAGTAPAAPARQPGAPGLMPVAAQYRAPGQPRG
jgi:prevent-host-death family protein